MRVAAVCCFTLLASACLPIPYQQQAWKDAPSQQTVPLSERLAPGDLVRVRTKEGTTHIFRVYKVEETAFYGVAKDKNKYRVGYGALASLEVRGTETAVEWVPVPVPLMVDFGGISSAGAGALDPAFLALLLAVGMRRPLTETAPNSRSEK